MTPPRSMSPTSTTGTLTAASGESVTLQMDTLAVNNASSIWRSESTSPTAIGMFDSSLARS